MLPVCFNCILYSAMFSVNFYCSNEIIINSRLNPKIACTCKCYQEYFLVNQAPPESHF